MNLEELYKDPIYMFGIAIVFIVCLCMMLLGSCEPARAENIDLSIIAKIESNNNPLAYNARSKAIGMYQITPICLKDYNTYHKGQEISYKGLLDPKKGYSVASWYLNIRIPQMLKTYHKVDTVYNRLWCYNAGIGQLQKGVLPNETKQYIKNYNIITN